MQTSKQPMFFSTQFDYKGSTVVLATQLSLRGFRALRQTRFLFVSDFFQNRRYWREKSLKCVQNFSGIHLCNIRCLPATV